LGTGFLRQHARTRKTDQEKRGDTKDPLHHATILVHGTALRRWWGMLEVAEKRQNTTGAPDEHRLKRIS
jgi:hypothetical protein